MKSIYEPIVQYMLSGKTKETLGSQVKRKCKFCNKDENSTSFHQIAHTVPELLGNTRLISFFECDSCNSKIFSKYESDLANFLQLYRGVRGSRGKRGKIGLTKGCKMEYNSETKTHKILMTSNFRKSKRKRIGVDMNLINDRVDILVRNNAKYIPINVYRAILKPSLSILNKDMLESYDDYIKLLFSDDISLVCQESYDIYTIVLNKPTTTPKMTLYKKSSLSSSVPSLLVSIEALQFVFNIFLYAKDESLLPFSKHSVELKKILHYSQYDAYDLRVKNFSKTSPIIEEQAEHITGFL